MRRREFICGTRERQRCGRSWRGAAARARAAHRGTVRKSCTTQYRWRVRQRLAELGWIEGRIWLSRARSPNDPTVMKRRCGAKWRT